VTNPQPPINDEQRLDRLRKHLGNRRWRMDNLGYTVARPIDGQIVQFRRNHAQRIIDTNEHNRMVILKSRQHGVTTGEFIRMLDACIFRPGIRCGVVAHVRDDARRWFNDKVLDVYARLPPEVKDACPIEAINKQAGEVLFRNGASIFVSVSLRGYATQILLVSEYGPMCAMDPARAEEVRTGALNTVQPGAIAMVESTAYGTGNDFHRISKEAQALDERIKAGTAKLTSMDYKFIFFPWFIDPKNEVPEREVEDIHISDAMLEYFVRIEHGIGHEIPPRKRAWYVKKQKEQGKLMTREHPSTPDEAFEAAAEAAYFGAELAAARREGRVCHIPIEKTLPVVTFWDIGRNDLTAIWFMQQIGKEYRFLDYMEDNGKDITYYAKWCLEWARKHGVRFSEHYLPHDIEVVELTRKDGKSRRRILEDGDIRPLVTVERTKDLGASIEAVRQAINVSYFDAERCEEGLARLGNYRRQRNRSQDSWGDTPAKTDDRNGTDAYRQFAQAYIQRPSAGKQAQRRKKRRREAPSAWAI